MYRSFVRKQRVFRAKNKVKINIFTSLFVIMFVAIATIISCNHIAPRNKKSNIVSISGVESILKTNTLLTPTEGIDTNVIAMIRTILKSENKNIKIEIEKSSSPLILTNGVIEYGDSNETVLIKIKITKNNLSSFYNASILIPAKIIKTSPITEKSAPQTKDWNVNIYQPTVITNIPSLPTPPAVTTIITPTITTNEINVINFGANGDESADDTPAIQKAVDYASSIGGGTVNIPAGIYLINPDISIIMKGNVNLKLSDDTILKATASGNQSYGIVTVKDVKDVNITGGKIIGDRAIHTDIIGELGMGISIQGSSNIRISDITITDCWGDGISLSESSLTDYASHVTVERVKLDNNRRRGISIISAKDLIVKDSIASNTNGANFQSGLGLNPDKTNQLLQNILIENLYTENNIGAGIDCLLPDISIGNPFPTSNINNIVIKNHSDSESFYGLGPGIQNYIDNGYDIVVQQKPINPESQNALRGWSSAG